jgi:hypothetical protein
MADEPAPTPPTLTNQVAHVGDVVKEWMDELVSNNQDFAGTGLPIVVYGPSDNASDAAPPLITWCPLTETTLPPQRQGAPKSPGAIYNRGIPISFELFGGLPLPDTYTDAEAPFIDCKLSEIMLSKLVNTIHRAVSPNAYAIDSVTWSNGGRTGIGMACEVVVQLKLPLIREDNPTVHVTGATVHTEIAHNG